MDADEIGTGSRVAGDPAVAEVELDGEAVLYHEALRTVCVLNPTATAIWNRLDGRTDLDAIAEDLAATFGAEVEVVRRDVVSTVRGLGHRGVLAGVAPDPALIAELRLLEPDQGAPPDG
jgi:hypothetical protein